MSKRDPRLDDPRCNGTSKENPTMGGNYIKDEDGYFHPCDEAGKPIDGYVVPSAVKAPVAAPDTKK